MTYAASAKIEQYIKTFKTVIVIFIRLILNGTSRTSWRYIDQSLQFTCQIKENKMIYLIVAVANLQQTVFLTIK